MIHLTPEGTLNRKKPTDTLRTSSGHWFVDKCLFDAHLIPTSVTGWKVRLKSRRLYCWKIDQQQCLFNNNWMAFSEKCNTTKLLNIGDWCLRFSPVTVRTVKLIDFMVYHRMTLSPQIFYGLSNLSFQISSCESLEENQPKWFSWWKTKWKGYFFHFII